ncbi:hypothetical protein BCV69DRAFT_194878 [Microstroma glucosiphilum]|uniref:Uncharacterized protein n=1 Tax=Pseudomicrostroma glucosiphilum TaxID=1684307 RepID=A0A316U850_9BASI|nr:hypothetical protein BCV69DRAFT_194878 [Pseudomicrostroma glucosiphilum]PWN20641.1 hypothetical protein BCV69DRAFT_194878 [Pseudomicrostroma glucosiphilum]
MSSRLPYGIRTQSGAASFKREVEQSLAPWREMIARDDARVVRSIHCPQVPNAADGFSPIVLYQIAVRDTGKVVQVSIQGKHNPLPNPVSAWNETRAQSRKRKGDGASSAASGSRSAGAGRSRTDSSEGKMAAAKRRLQMINDEEDAREAEACHDENADGRPELRQDDECDEEELSQRKRVALQGAYAKEGQPYADDQQYYDGYDYDEAAQAEEEDIPADVIAHVSLHPPTPQKKPSKPSSRLPGPPRYSARRSTSLAAQGLAPQYGLNDLREPDGSIRYFPSTAANSEAGESCGGETVYSNVTYTQQNPQQRGLRRSSRLASLPPGSLDEEGRHHQEQVRATAHRLAEVELHPLVEMQEQQQNGIDAEENEDVDMSSMILDYEDEEETRLAHEQMRREGQRRILTEQEVARRCPPLYT